MMVNPVRPVNDYAEVVIANGESLSGACDMGNRVLTGVSMPATWTSAGLSFAVSNDNSTFKTLYNTSGEITASAAASVFVGIDPSSMFGFRYLKVRSGTAGSPVNQGGARTLVLSLGDPTL